MQLLSAMHPGQERRGGTPPHERRHLLVFEVVRVPPDATPASDASLSDAAMSGTWTCTAAPERGGNELNILQTLTWKPRQEPSRGCVIFAVFSWQQNRKKHCRTCSAATSDSRSVIHNARFTVHDSRFEMHDGGMHVASLFLAPSISPPFSPSPSFSLWGRTTATAPAGPSGIPD